MTQIKSSTFANPSGSLTNKGRKVKGFLYVKKKKKKRKSSPIPTAAYVQVWNTATVVFGGIWSGHHLEYGAGSALLNDTVGNSSLLEVPGKKAGAPSAGHSPSHDLDSTPATS